MTKSQDLYQSSLENGWQDSKSYDINQLLYVAFFGGVIPLIVLGRRNANWLQVSNKKLIPFIIIAIILIIGKFLLAYAVLKGNLSIETMEIKFGYRIGCVLLFIYLKTILKKSFQQHMVTNGETVPLIKPAIIWILIAIVIETVILAPLLTAL